MPHNPIRVVVGPANYFSHPGSFNHLHDFFTDEQLSRAAWIYGERAIAAAQTKLPPAFELPGAKHILFRGHCSESDVQQLAAESGDDRSVVIGVGGGALLDTAKALARRLGLPFVAAPTIAATCAAWTPLSPSGITMPDRRCIMRFSTTPILWCWWNRRLSSMHRNNICWRGSVTRWRNGMKRWCWLRNENRCR